MNNPKEFVTLIIAEFIRLTCSVIETFSFFLVSFSLYRIPIRRQFAKLLLISLFISIFSLFQRDIVELVDYVIVTTVVSSVIFIIVLTRLTVLWALLICISGYVMYTIVQGLLIVAGQALDLTSTEQLTQSLLHGSVIQLLSAFVMFGIAAWLQKNKYGFMLKTKRMTWKEAAGGFNLILSLTIVAAFFLLEVCLLSFRENTSIVYGLIALIVILLAVLYVVYRKNKQEIQFAMERFKRL